MLTPCYSNLHSYLFLFSAKAPAAVPVYGSLPLLSAYNINIALSILFKIFRTLHKNVQPLLSYLPEMQPLPPAGDLPERQLIPIQSRELMRRPFDRFAAAEG